MGVSELPTTVVVKEVKGTKVYNLSSIRLPEEAVSVAELGPKFVPLTQSDTDQTKIDILNFSRTLLLRARFHNSDYQDESLITPISNYIPKSTPFTSLKSIIEDLEMFANEVPNLDRVNKNDNLSPKQRAGLNFLKNNKNVLFFKADKGGSVVFLDPDQYSQLVLEKLDTPNYEKLVRNTDYFTMVKLQNFVRRYTKMLTPNEKRAITGFDYKSTYIYGAPKIHKSRLIKDAIKNCYGTCLNLRRPSDLSLRIIFGGPKSVTTGIANLVDKLLKPFVSLVKARVRDVNDFINRIPVFPTTTLPSIQMWSVDVKDMYQNIEHDLGLEAIEFWLDRYPEMIPKRFSKKCILEALLFVLENNSGYFDGSFYRQIRGTATGIKPAPSYADLTMGYLEIKLFYQLKLKMNDKVAGYFWENYRRYLDDGQIMWDVRLGNFKEVLNLMNGLHPAIEFTSECSDIKLVYLNVTILKTDQGFKTEIYNKDTDSDIYLPFSSSHPRHCREAIPFGLARSVRALTDDDNTVQDKLRALNGRLSRCGYPQGIVSTAFKSALALRKDDLRKSKSEDENKYVLPFVHQYDPTLPQIFSRIKELTSRLFSSRELKPIFGNYRLIDSQREPLSIGSLLQHSKFDSSLTISSGGVTKCGIRGCACCEDILEVSSFYFENSGINFNINFKMNCTVRNVIYMIQCKKCNQTYIGETINFRTRMSGHKSKSGPDAIQEVNSHLYECGKGFWKLPIFKVNEESKISRLVIEDKLIKKLKPDLNRDQRDLLHLSIGSYEN